MATFTTSFTLSAGAGTINPSALSITTTATETLTKDAGSGTLYLRAGETQTIYAPTEPVGSIPSMSYVYVAATSVSASGLLDIKYTSGSVVTTIGQLSNGDWMYLPLKVVAGAGSQAFPSSSLTITNNTNLPASASFVFAENGGTLGL